MKKLLILATAMLVSCSKHNSDSKKAPTVVITEEKKDDNNSNPPPPPVPLPVLKPVEEIENGICLPDGEYSSIDLIEDDKCLPDAPTSSIDEIDDTKCEKNSAPKCPQGTFMVNGECEPTVISYEIHTSNHDTDAFVDEKYYRTKTRELWAVVKTEKTGVVVDYAAMDFEHKVRFSKMLFEYMFYKHAEKDSDKEFSVKVSGKTFFPYLDDEFSYVCPHFYDFLQAHPDYNKSKKIIFSKELSESWCNKVY